MRHILRNEGSNSPYPAALDRFNNANGSGPPLADLAKHFCLGMKIAGAAEDHFRHSELNLPMLAENSVSFFAIAATGGSVDSPRTPRVDRTFKQLSEREQRSA